MDTDKKKLLADFSHRALQRLRDKKIPKRQTLHIPSMDMDLTIRSLDYGEIMECMTLEDNGDIKRSDKYSIYLAAVEPSLRDRGHGHGSRTAPGGSGAEGAAGHREYV